MIATPDTTHPAWKQWNTDLAVLEADARERDLVVIGLAGSDAGHVGPDALTRQAAQTLRADLQLDPGAFSVVLIGKDGGVKVRAGETMRLTDIFARIDTMPMRRQEMRRQERQNKP